ncbi:hypothetical protein D3C87_2063180 [compost metagenome]
MNISHSFAEKRIQDLLIAMEYEKLVLLDIGAYYSEKVHRADSFDVADQNASIQIY